ncbi:MAG TPA: type II toxin-antitoxin system RelE/ParE family toxin [Paraburkholderia sp.]
MNTINQTDEFRSWLGTIKDKTLKGAVIGRITRAAHGSFGDCHDVGNGVWEMRIHIGGGARVYYVRDGSTVYLLLSGGDKKGQDADIAAAKALWTSILKERKK